MKATETIVDANTTVIEGHGGLKAKGDGGTCCVEGFLIEGFGGLRGKGDGGSQI